MAVASRDLQLQLPFLPLSVPVMMMQGPLNLAVVLLLLVALLLLLLPLLWLVLLVLMPALPQRLLLLMPLLLPAILLPMPNILPRLLLLLLIPQCPQLPLLVLLLLVLPRVPEQPLLLPLLLGIQHLLQVQLLLPQLLLPLPVASRFLMRVVLGLDAASMHVLLWLDCSARSSSGLGSLCRGQLGYRHVHQQGCMTTDAQVLSLANIGGPNPAARPVLRERGPRCFECYRHHMHACASCVLVGTLLQQARAVLQAQTAARSDVCCISAL
mmetsp:Transcript_33999/g.75368  ORF Transcript_33999/g.75368 Transcript_33999/m.75368 type:complete len:269 (-) Transcript_33999:956-1762(-)